MTTADAQHERPGTMTRGWRAFRRWRRSRPFWGGLLLALAGLEIFGTTQMNLGGLTFQMGPTGFLSWLIPTILVACGMLMWFTPQQRMFYAIVGSVTTVFSLIAVNLGGGFFIGLLLGMVGGALGFAWTPTAPAQPDVAEDKPGADGDPAATGVDRLLDGNQGWPAGDEPDRPVSAEAPGEEPADLLHDTLPQPRNPLRESTPTTRPEPTPTGPSRPGRTPVRPRRAAMPPRQIRSTTRPTGRTGTSRRVAAPPRRRPSRLGCGAPRCTGCCSSRSACR